MQNCESDSHPFQGSCTSGQRYQTHTYLHVSPHTTIPVSVHTQAPAQEDWFGTGFLLNLSRTHELKILLYIPERPNPLSLFSKENRRREIASFAKCICSHFLSKFSGWGSDSVLGLQTNLALTQARKEQRSNPFLPTAVLREQKL